MSRAAVRLHAYLAVCLARAARGGRHWLRLPLSAFMKASGYAERTVRGAWAEVRGLFEARLVRIGRSNVSMVALLGTLSPCTFPREKGKPSVLEKKNTTEHGPAAARTRMMDSQDKSSKSHRCRDPMARLAAWLAWRLGHCHWETCRVRFNPGFARVYAARALSRGYARSTIEAAYEVALREEHTIACDVGVGTWRPLRIMGLALSKLNHLAPDWRAESSAKVPTPQRRDRNQRINLATALTRFCDSVAPDPNEDYTTHERLAA